jgi:lysophospholipase L1-like esterase
MIRHPRARLALLAMAAAPLFAACSIDNQTMGVRGAPAGGAQFARVSHLGTSISAGFESGGINDSTQRESPMYQLALGMGLTPGVDWFYPSFGGFGCPAPYINPLTGGRVGGVSAAYCGTRNAASAAPYMSNTAIPGLRAGHVLDLTYLGFPKTDTLKLANFITGGINPINMVLAQHPTFVTIEVGANDVLGGATNADTTLFTPVAAFTSIIGAIRDSINTLTPKPGVAIANLPNPLFFPHFTRASVMFCLKTGACPGVPATPPFSLASFTIDASCAPNAAGGVGDGYLIPLATTGALISSATPAVAGGLGRSAKIDCARDSVLVGTPASPATPVAPAGLRLNTAAFASLVTRIANFNAAIVALANTEGWALADWNGAFTAQAANVPAIPNFSNQLALFACPAAGCPTGTATLFSQDGLHLSKAGYKVLAQAFATAINAKYGSSITIP